MGRLKICVSSRCFFPKTAFTSSKEIVKLAKSLGYSQVEFHPTWSIFWEMLTRRKLSCQSEDISSFHVSWREDALPFGLGFFKRNFLTPVYWLFPPEPLGTKAIQKLEKIYQKPVVVHWPEDFVRFRSPLLELQWPLKLNLKQVEKAIRTKSIKGVVIDTYKLKGWLEDQKEKESMVLHRLFPYIGEVHFRFKQQKDLESLFGGRKTDTIRVMERLLKMDYQNQVVVEMGWPDVGSLKTLGSEGTKKVHQEIIRFLIKGS